MIKYLILLVLLAGCATDSSVELINKGMAGCSSYGGPVSVRTQDDSVIVKCKNGPVIIRVYRN